MRAKYTETADISERKSGRMPSFGTVRAKKNQVQAESQANANQEAVRERTMESKEGGASEIICQGKGRARICGHKGTASVSENRKTRYRGLRKQIAKLNMLFALANLVLADRLCPAV